MPKYWIDSDGQQRLDHDENYQMVSSGTFTDDVALQMDSWDIERACKMIVLGFNENTKEAIEYGLKHCAEGSTGRDRAHALITIMNRVLTLAKSAIAIGILKETDTPKNWIAWAQSKGYKTNHINPLSIDDAHSEAVADVGLDDSGTELKPREGGYKPRDEFAIQQVLDRPELLEMRAGAIKVELQKASNLFTSGFDDWWRENPIFKKSNPGRNPK